MYNYHFAAIVTFCSIAIFGSKSAAQYPAQVKIMTYNIQGENAKHKGGDYSDIANVIKAIKPTICGMQKIDSLSVTANQIDVLKYLGEQAGMKSTFSMSYKVNNGAWGIGFLSDSVPKSSRRLALPKGTASEDRSALEIGMTMGGERVRVIVTHLAYEASDAIRVTQLQQILPWITAGGTATDPVVIMADFNAVPTTNSMKLLTDSGFAFVKGKNGTILDTSTGQNINHILYRPAARWKINDAGNPSYTSASNRNPVWADMELLNPVPVMTQSAHKKYSINPKPFFSHGVFHYNLTNPATVSLQLYNAAGKLMRTVIDNRHQEAGRHAFTPADTRLPCGIYQAVLSVDGSSYVAATAIVR